MTARDQIRTMYEAYILTHRTDPQVLRVSRELFTAYDRELIAMPHAPAMEYLLFKLTRIVPDDAVRRSA